jgi:hypothetical protein
MKNKNKSYSMDEDAIIVDCVVKCPQNLQSAFFKAARKINRTPEGVTQRYYNKLRKGIDMHSLKSDEKSVVNTKNSPRKASENNDLFDVVAMLVGRLNPTDKMRLIESMF